MKNYLFMFLGFVFMGLGIAGIYLPVLPGVLFLIISAYCFATSNPEYYNKIINNKNYGDYVKNYIEHNVIPYRVKKIILSFIWICSAFSIFYALKHNLLIYRLLVFIIALVSSLIILKAKSDLTNE